MLFPLFSDQSYPNTSRRHGKQVPHSPTLEWTWYSGKQLACPPASPHCTQHVHFQTGNQCMISHTWGGSTVTCKGWRAAQLCTGWALLHSLGAMPTQQENTSGTFCSPPNYLLLFLSIPALEIWFNSSNLNWRKPWPTWSSMSKSLALSRNCWNTDTERSLLNSAPVILWLLSKLLPHLNSL